MKTKLEIRTRMAELQKEFVSLNAEMKEIEEGEKRAASREKYQAYLYKVGTYGYVLDPEEKILDATDKDREEVELGLSGLAYTGFENKARTFGYVMLKDKTDHARVKKIFEMLDAVEHLKDEKVKDKEKHLKVLLGESNGNA